MIHVTAVQAYTIGFPGPITVPLDIFVAATGTVPTSGWTGVRLLPRVGPKSKPELWEFDMVADAPSGIVLQVQLPVVAAFSGFAPPEATTVRVYGGNGEYVDAAFVDDAPRKKSEFQINRMLDVLYQRQIARYDDSHQPTGTIIWLNDGFMGSPTPHAEMKRLEHILTLRVEGPTNETVEACVNEAATAAVITGLIVGFTTGGMAGVSAAGTTFCESVKSCLGANFTVTLYDDSHWIYWTT